MQLTRAQWRLLGLLGAATFFEGYDMNIVSVALPQLRESFGLSQSAASLWIALLYLGAVPALALGRWADRVGRRRVLLISVTGYTVMTALTALAPGIVLFALCQLVARAFLAVELAVSWTYVTEELPDDRRGLGFGVLATSSALGVGWGSLLWGLVLSPAGLSWRWLYALAVPVLVLVAVLRRQLPEGRRFAAASAAGRLVPHWREALRPSRGLLVLVCVVTVLVNLTAQATLFVVDFLQTQRGLSPSTASLVLVGAGAVAIPVLRLAGGLSDTLGRRPLGAGFLVVEAVGTVGFFGLAHSLPALVGCLVVLYVGVFGAWPTLSAYGTELFGVEVRALARSVVGLAQVLGQSSSFLVASGLLALTDSLSTTVAVLCCGPLLGAVLVLRAYPETAGRALDPELAAVSSPT